MRARSASAGACGRWPARRPGRVTSTAPAGAASTLRAPCASRRARSRCALELVGQAARAAGRSSAGGAGDFHQSAAIAPPLRPRYGRAAPSGRVGCGGGELGGKLRSQRSTEMETETRCSAECRVLSAKWSAGSGIVQSDGCLLANGATSHAGTRRLNSALATVRTRTPLGTLHLALGTAYALRPLLTCAASLPNAAGVA